MWKEVAAGIADGDGSDHENGADDETTGDGVLDAQGLVGMKEPPLMGLQTLDVAMAAADEIVRRRAGTISLGGRRSSVDATVVSSAPAITIVGDKEGDKRLDEQRRGQGKVIRVPGTEEPTIFHGAAFAQAKVKASGFDQGDLVHRSMQANADFARASRRLAPSRTTPNQRANPFAPSAEEVDAL